MLRRLSHSAGYLALLLTAIAACVVSYAFVTLYATELMANVAYYSLIVAFGCFVFWAVSATYLVIQKHQQK